MKEYYILRMGEDQEDVFFHYHYDDAMNMARDYIRDRAEGIDRPKKYDKDFKELIGVNLYKISLKSPVSLPYEEWCAEMYDEYDRENLEDEERCNRNEYDTLVRLCEKYKDQVPTILKVLEAKK